MFNPASRIAADHAEIGIGGARPVRLHESRPWFTIRWRGGGNQQVFASIRQSHHHGHMHVSSIYAGGRLQ